jgi:SAM-dependent methyltransferase
MSSSPKVTDALIDPGNDPRLRFERVDRCLCGGNLLEGPIWEWMICGGCGTWVNTKRPTEESLGIVYGETYWTTTQALVGAPPLERRFQLDMNDRIPVYLKQLTPHLPATARIGELGCGNARLLHELKGMGHEVVGTEYDAGMIARLAQLTDVPIQQGGAELFESASFDAMLSLDVLEHLHDPAAFLREHKRLLKPGGLLLLHTPVHERANEPYRYSVGLLWKLYHLYLFSRQLIDEMVDAAGFEVIADEARMFGWPIFVLRKR